MSSRRSPCRRRKRWPKARCCNLAEIGQFTDPGFTRTARPERARRSHTPSIGATELQPARGNVTTVTQGNAGTLTSGALSGSHAYADDGSYTVTVTVTDDDGGADTKTFAVDGDERSANTHGGGKPDSQRGIDTDRHEHRHIHGSGFANAAQSRSRSGRRRSPTRSNGAMALRPAREPPRSTRWVPPARRPSGSFDGSHTYADNGTYAVTVTVTDDDGGTTSQSLQVTVSNVAPTLGVIWQSTGHGRHVAQPHRHRRVHGSGLRQRAQPRRGRRRDIHVHDQLGRQHRHCPAARRRSTRPDPPGVLTAGSFNGSHTYTAAGTYTVTVRRDRRR